MMICSACKQGKHYSCLSKLPLRAVRCDCDTCAQIIKDAEDDNPESEPEYDDEAEYTPIIVEEPKTLLRQITDRLYGYEEVYDMIAATPWLDEASGELINFVINKMESPGAVPFLKLIYTLGAYNYAIGKHSTKH